MSAARFGPLQDSQPDCMPPDIDAHQDRRDPELSRQAWSTTQS